MRLVAGNARADERKGLRQDEKKGAYLINTARGPWSTRPRLSPRSIPAISAAPGSMSSPTSRCRGPPLIGRDNVILTPHTAFYSVEALEELQTKCATDVARVLSGEKAIYPISA